MQVVDEGERELYGIDADIGALYRLYLQLGERRAALNRRTTKCKSLVSPIRRLPPELLSQIFTWYSIDGNRLYMLPDIPGRTLGSVCSHWRSVTLATQQIWSAIHIDLGLKPLKLAATKEALSAIISRSGTAPLTIQLYKGAFVGWEVARELISILGTAAHRWKKLSVSHGVSLVGLGGFLAPFRTQFSVLSSFDVWSPVTVGSLAVPFTIFEAVPTLRSADLHRFSSQDIRIPYAALESLTIAFQSLQRLHDFLSASTSLKKLTANLSSYPADPPLENLVPSLANIEALALRQGTRDSMGEIFNSLTLPLLTNLRLYNFKGHAGPDHLWPTAAFNSLKIRSRFSLTVLALENVTMDTNTLLSLFQVLPNLTSLTIHESVLWVPWVNEDDDDEPGTEEPDQSSMFSPHVFTMLNPESTHYGPFASTPVLLPCLRTLTLKHRVNGDPEANQAFDTAFVDMIRGRWDSTVAASDETVSCLKVASLQLFSRAFTLSQDPTIRRLRMAGMSITLIDKGGVIA